MLGWTKNWNRIIREVIYHDHDLKQLMKLPPKTGVIQFTDRYFVKAGYTSKLLTDEVCRIVYGNAKGSPTNVPNVRIPTIIFDIYVKEDEQRTVGDDGLLLRSDLIAERLFKLLTQNRYMLDTAYRFMPAGDWEGGTRTAGYVRRTLAFEYMKVY